MSLTVFEGRVNSFDVFTCGKGLSVNNCGVLPQRPVVTLRETYWSRTDTSKNTLKSFKGHGKLVIDIQEVEKTICNGTSSVVIWPKTYDVNKIFTHFHRKKEPAFNLLWGSPRDWPSTILLFLAFEDGL